MIDMQDSYKTVAEEALAECERLQGLLQASMNKRASASGSVIQESVQAMIKCGSLTQDQKDEAVKLMSENPDAALKAIQGLCNQIYNAKTLVKSASADELNVGSLAAASAKKPEVAPDYSSVAKILGII